MLFTEDGATHDIQATQYVPVDLVRNGVTYIILYSMFATLLFVLLCAVLFKNGLSPQKRRLPVVWVLGFAMLGGLLGSTLNTVFWAYQLFGNVSQDAMFRLWMSSTAMLYLVPLITHVAIQLRILGFFPPTLASRSKRIVISILPTLMKVARLTTISITLTHASRTYKAKGFGYTVSLAANDISNLFTLIFQLVDTVYASIFLLWQFWHLGRRDSELMSKKSHPAIRWSKQIMFAIAFGYVLPTIYALALVLSRALSLSAVDMGFMLVANVYVQAFGAVLASLSSAHRWREDRFTDNLAPDNAVLPGLRNASDPFTAANAKREASPLESVMIEPGTPIRSVSTTTPSLAAIVTDGMRVATPSSKSGDISPKSSAVRAIDSDEKRIQFSGTTHELAIEFPSTYPSEHSESRRSSDATLFAPLNSSADKLDGKLGGTPAGSRPGSSGTVRIQRLGSGRSVPREGSLLEEEEGFASPQASSQSHDN